MWNIDRKLILAGILVAAIPATTNVGFGIYDRIYKTSPPVAIEVNIQCDGTGLSMLSGSLAALYRSKTSRSIEPELSLEAAKAACSRIPPNPSPQLKEVLNTLSDAFATNSDFTPEQSRIFVEETRRNLEALARSSPEVGKRLSETTDGLQQLTQNFVDNTINLPGLVSRAAYAAGTFMGILGALEIKHQVENPSQTPLKDGAVRLGNGGALKALPFLYQVMIENETGVSTQVIQLQGLNTSETVTSP